jgi:hypothetical protein
MAEWAAVNITKGKTTVSLKHWWGVLEDMLPIMKSFNATKPTVKSMYNALLKVNKGQPESRQFHPMTLEDAADQQNFCTFSYDLYATKDDWEIEVWSNPGYPLLEIPAPVTDHLAARSVSGLEKICIGHVTPSHIPTNRIVIVKRMPLAKVTKRTLEAAYAAKDAESNRVRAEALKPFWKTGEVVSIEAGKMTVKFEDGKSTTMPITTEEAAQVQVGRKVDVEFTRAATA